jgi:gas vesicle protein
VTTTLPNSQDLQGQVLYDSSGEEVGVIEGVYLDNATRRPEWAAVRVGPEALALVPLAGASSSRGGAQVEFDLDMILDAPFQLTALDNEVTEETEQLLYRYYQGGGGMADEAGEVASTVKDEAADVVSTAKEQAVDVASTAKEEAADVAASAKDEAADVVSTAKEQASTVVEMAKAETAEVADVVAGEARDMVETTRSELETQAQTQLEQISESLYRLAGQALALARGNAEQAGPLGELVGRAGHELQGAAIGIEERGSAGMLSDAQRIVRQRPRAAIMGTAAAVVAGARLMGTPAGERLKEYVAPLKDQAIEAGKNVAEELKPIAQARAERVKTVAVQAADQVKADAQGTVQDVKGTTKQSAQVVKGTAKRSAAAVKGTAKQSSSTVKSTAKRSARTAAPVG